MGTAGLGLKRKTENIQMQQQQQEQKRATLGQSTFGKMMKAKTLAEKRQNLQAEILKYGVAAIEKMYPRQAYVKVKLPPLFGLSGFFLALSLLCSVFDIR